MVSEMNHCRPRVVRHRVLTIDPLRGLVATVAGTFRLTMVRLEETPDGFYALIDVDLYPELRSLPLPEVGPCDVPW